MKKYRWPPLTAASLPELRQEVGSQAAGACDQPIHLAVSGERGQPGRELSDRLQPAALHPAADQIAAQQRVRRRQILTGDQVDLGVNPRVVFAPLGAIEDGARTASRSSPDTAHSRCLKSPAVG